MGIVTITYHDCTIYLVPSLHKHAAKYIYILSRWQGGVRMAFRDLTFEILGMESYDVMKNPSNRNQVL